MKGLQKGYMRVIQDDSGITENKMETTLGLRVEGLGFASVDARGVRLFLGFGGTHPVAHLRSLVVPPQTPKLRVLGSCPPKRPPPPLARGSSVSCHSLNTKLKPLKPKPRPLINKLPHLNRDYNRDPNI